MLHSNLTHWIEDRDGRETCRDAAFVIADDEKQYLHLGATIARVAEWWHHNVTNEVLPVHYEPSTRH